MSKALDAIKNAHLVSVDFDGVILEQIFSRSWNTEPLNPNRPSSPLEWFFTRILHKIRKQVPGCREALTAMKEMNKRLVVLTARNPLTSVLAKNWMAAVELDHFFDGFYNADFIQRAGEFKGEIIKKLSIDVHIDDDIGVVRHISSMFPNKTFIWLSPKNSDLKKLGFGPNVIHLKKWADLFE